MSNPQTSAQSGAPGAHIEKDGDNWTLVLVRDFAQPPVRVWRALTDPEELRQWAPFDADKSMATPGATVKLTTIGAPKEHITETIIRQADAAKTLEYDWGGGPYRWELKPQGKNGTRLTLWAKINRAYIAMGAAGMHVCFDVLDALLAGKPVGRLAGPQAMQDGNWQRLHAEYQKQFGIETPGWSSQPKA